MDKLIVLLLLPRTRPTLLRFEMHLFLGIDTTEIEDGRDLGVPGVMLSEDIAESGDRVVVSPIGLSFFVPSMFLDAALFIAFVNVSSSAATTPSEDTILDRTLRGLPPRKINPEDDSRYVSWHLLNGVCVLAALRSKVVVADNEAFCHDEPMRGVVVCDSTTSKGS